MANEEWKHEIRGDFLDVFRKNPKDYAVLLSFLDNSDKDYPGKAAAWSLLRLMQEKRLTDKMKAYADEIIKEEKNRRERRIHQQVANANGQDAQQNIRRLPTVIFNYMQSSEGAQVGFGTGLAQIWHTLGKEIQTKLLGNMAESCCRQIGGSSCCTSMLKTHCGSFLALAVSLCRLLVNIKVNVERWWKDELTGQQCAKMCVESSVEYGAGFLGALGGAALGAMVNPICAVFLATFAGVVSGAAAKALVEWLTSKIFNVEVDIATETAYRYLELDYHATPVQIHKAYETKMDQNDKLENEQERMRLGSALKIHRSIILVDQTKRFGNVLPTAIIPK